MENLRLLLACKRYRLVIRLWTGQDAKALTCIYDDFGIGKEEDGYALKVGGLNSMSTNCQDGLRQLNKAHFVTRERTPDCPQGVNTYIQLY